MGTCGIYMSIFSYNKNSNSVKRLKGSNYFYNIRTETVRPYTKYKIDPLQ